MSWKRKETSRKNPLLASGHTHGQNSEKRVLMNLGARQVIASGSIDVMKSDGELPGYRIECKSTVNDSIGLKLDWLRKITQEASERSTQPILTLSFVTGDGKPRKCGDWAVIPLSVLQELLGGSDE